MGPANPPASCQDPRPSLAAGLFFSNRSADEWTANSRELVDARELLARIG